MSKESRKDERNKNFETFRALTQFSQIGITMASSVFIGVIAGKYLDQWLGTSPWFLIIVSMLGVGSAIKLVFSNSKPKK